MILSYQGNEVVCLASGLNLITLVTTALKLILTLLPYLFLA